VLVATLSVLTDYGVYGKDDTTPLTQATQTLAIDTYITLAANHPESTTGAHYPLQGIVDSAVDRLTGITDGTTAEIDVKQKQEPGLYLGELSKFFGHEYYRQTRPYVFQTLLPLPSDRANALSRALIGQCV
jgi:hypothetical protein